MMERLMDWSMFQDRPFPSVIKGLMAVQSVYTHLSVIQLEKGMLNMHPPKPRHTHTQVGCALRYQVWELPWFTQATFLTCNLRPAFPSCKLDPIFVSYVKRHNPITSLTLCRWLRAGLTNAAIDTDTFKADSVRGASTTAAMNLTTL